MKIESHSNMRLGSKAQRNERNFVPQEDGILGKGVGKMIMRSLRARFHTIYWIPPALPIESPSILVPNHHGWFDGYLMFAAIKKLELPCIDWIVEYDSFPLFGKVGGLPFPKNDPSARIYTIRRSIRWMAETKKNLLLFAEGVLHSGPEIYILGKSLKTVARAVPVQSVVPVAIVYEMSLHERPVAFIRFGNPVQAADFNQESMTLGNFRLIMEALLAETRVMIKESRDSFEVLTLGTKDVNERFSFKRTRE